MCWKNYINSGTFKYLPNAYKENRIYIYPVCKDKEEYLHQIILTSALALKFGSVN